MMQCTLADRTRDNCTVRRPPRFLLHSLRYFSLLLLLFVIVLWMRSYFIIDELAWTHRDSRGNYSNNARRTSLTTGPGHIFLHDQKTWSYEIQLEGLGTLTHGTLKSYWDDDVRLLPDPQEHRESIWNYLGFHLFTNSFLNITTVVIPFWILALLVAIPSAIHLPRHRPHKPGLCSKCGYDLRATPDLCPECGQSSIALKSAA